MDIGNGWTISDKWIPKGVSTDVKDINGYMLKTSDKVKLNGCKSRYAIVGICMKGIPVIYFSTEDASVMWYLDQETVAKHKITFVE